MLWSYDIVAKGKVKTQQTVVKILINKIFDEDKYCICASYVGEMYEVCSSGGIPQHQKKSSPCTTFIFLLILCKW